MKISRIWCLAMTALIISMITSILPAGAIQVSDISQQGTVLGTVNTGGVMRQVETGPSDTVSIKYITNGKVTGEVITSPDGTVVIRYLNDGNVLKQAIIGPSGNIIGSVGGGGTSGVISSPGTYVSGSTGGGATRGYVSGPSGTVSGTIT